MRRRALSETREGRLTIIMLAGGSLLMVLAAANIWMAIGADDQAEQVRRALRRGLAGVPDETLADFPSSGDAIEQAAARALPPGTGRVVGAARPDDDEVVVAVEAGLGWQIRCIEAELRGHRTVLTASRAGPC